jgi:hypothetical protein
MTKNKRGTLVDVIDDYGHTYWIFGHDLTEEEVFRGIFESDRGEMEFHAETYEQFRGKWQISLKQESCGRWGICTCGEDHYHDMYRARPGTRGAFLYTMVEIKPINEEKIENKLKTEIL